MMQNILAFRFSNTFLESSWNYQYIESVSIVVPEKFGINGRFTFYEGIGALRDIGQNHLLQMLALVTMEEPEDYSYKEIRKKRAKVLNNLHLLKREEISKSTYRAQYGSYKFEEGVKEGSTTETYFKIKTYIKNSRWKNVPIYLESGKKMETTDKKIYVTYREKMGKKNQVVFDLDGDDMGINIQFNTKKPGFEMDLENKVFTYSLCDDHEKCKLAGEYEKLLLDAIEGDQTLFVSNDEVKAMWKFIDPIINGWKDNLVPLEFYDDNAVLNTVI
jgi:glucose-6-phosphate 1-dehydrogenase